ncbi:hypothetical protein VB780_30560 [Leptolyngbya sp. CCNP1308]|uniref:hypothetical protein n=1 Tax=Leptolyngbya sp. CCNP1308 TaxID=3110255 RepID=UPI002B221387|nr:hypothetical protein [Leptolyngbya sp. CCNP1308]MEA5452953.1 hypothetical protein [Leptolyngbya sp. CCNP1308]
MFIPEVSYLPKCYTDVTDEARLLYVAMTRAIEVLVLSCDRRSVFTERLEGALKRSV